MLVPCRHTLAKHCPSCADRNQALRASQCLEGWHLEDEPDITPGPSTENQRWWITLRAEARQLRDQAEASRTDATDFDELITELDAEITGAGMRGKVAPARPKRRHRSTRRRQRYGHARHSRHELHMIYNCRPCRGAQLGVPMNLERRQAGW